MIEQESFKKICEVELTAMMGCMSVPAGHNDPIPMLVTIDYKGDTVCNGLANFGQLADSAARQRFLYEMGKRIGEEGSLVMMTFMAFFAWSTVLGQDEIGSDFPAPRENPERQEILAFSGTSLDGKTATAAIPTGRNQFKPELEGTNFPDEVEIKFSGSGDNITHNYLMSAFWKGMAVGRSLFDEKEPSDE